MDIIPRRSSSFGTIRELLLVCRIEKIVIGILLHMKFAHFLVHYLLEVVNICALACRNKETVVGEFRHPCRFKFVKGKVLLCLRGKVVLLFGYIPVSIHFVEDYHHGLVAAVEVGKCLVYYLYLFLEVGMGNIYNV